MPRNSSAGAIVAQPRQEEEGQTECHILIQGRKIYLRPNRCNARPTEGDRASEEALSRVRDALLDQPRCTVLWGPREHSLWARRHVIVHKGPGKTANKESLARNEGGCRTPQLRKRRTRPYKGVNCARHLRRQPIFPSMDAAVRRTAKLQMGAWGRLRRPSRKKNHMIP